MGIKCKLLGHRWKYNKKNLNTPIFNLIEHTRYCERCERIEKTLTSFKDIFPPIWEKVKLNPTSVKEKE